MHIKIKILLFEKKISGGIFFHYINHLTSLFSNHSIILIVFVMQIRGQEKNISICMYKEI